MFCGLRRNLVIYLILHQVGLDGVSARPWCLESSTAEVYLGTNVVSAVTADSSGVFDVDLEIVGSGTGPGLYCSFNATTSFGFNFFSMLWAG